MANTFDFNALKKRYLTITLPDENRTKLMLMSPSKKILDEFIAINEVFENQAETEAINEIYDLVTRALNYNKAGVKLSRDTIESLLDLEDVIAFIKAYSDFLSNVTSEKN